MMGSDFKFVHCADLHLGSRFKGVSEKDPSAGRRMRESAFESFGRIVDLVLSEGADALVISGDIYDDGNALPSTRSRFCSELSRLGDVPVFLCRGNHDSSTSWDGSIPYPGNVHEFGTEPEGIVVDSAGGPFEVVGISFGTSHEERNLVSMLSGRPDMFTVACVHCDVDPAEGLSYAPCRSQDLVGRGVDYWALGHIHRRQVLSERPFAVYPGNIQGRSFRETGPKGAYVVTVSSGSVSDLRFVPTQSMMWHDIAVDITGRSLPDISSEISGSVGKGDLVRITFTGSGQLDGMLRTDAEDAVAVLERSTGCRIASWDVSTSPDFDVWSMADGDDLASKVVSVGRDLSSDRSAVLERILSNPVLARHRGFFESLTDEELSKVVEDASRLVVASMGGSR